VNLDQLGYRPESAMKVIDVGRTTLYQLLRTGEIESIKVGRTRIIPADALRDFMERKRQEQNGEPSPRGA
jgi:excisionase family DNA binding protein